MVLKTVRGRPAFARSGAVRYTLALGLQYFRTLATAGGDLREHLLMAGAMMMTASVLVVFVALQRYFTQGIVLSGLKG